MRLRRGVGSACMSTSSCELVASNLCRLPTGTATNFIHLLPLIRVPPQVPDGRVAAQRAAP